MLKLTRAPVPTVPPDAVEGDLEKLLTRHPSFCGVCLNLSIDVAKACHGGRQHLHCLPGIVDSWTFLSVLDDVKAGIAEGCGSCTLLKMAIDAEFCKALDWDDPENGELDIHVTMQDGFILNLYIPEMPCGSSAAGATRSASLDLYAGKGEDEFQSMCFSCTLMERHRSSPAMDYHWHIDSKIRRSALLVWGNGLPR